MLELAPGVFVEMGFQRVTVGAILTDDGFVLIDTPPYPEDARRWQMMLASIADKPVVAIINTDGHRDRILGNGWFDCPVIVAHDETINTLQNLPSNFVDLTVEDLIQHSFERSQFAHAQLKLPNIGFSQRIQLRYGNRTIPLLTMPGPTAGSVWVHLPEARVLFAGDSVLADQHPYLTSPCTKDWLGNLTVLRRSRFAADHIVPGRGMLVDKRATEPLSSYLRTARRRVQSLYREGRPRADTATLVPELLDLFPYDPYEIEDIQRRIKTGLDRIYEEFKTNDKDDPQA